MLGFEFRLSMYKTNMLHLYYLSGPEVIDKYMRAGKSCFLHQRERNLDLFSLFLGEKKRHLSHATTVRFQPVKILPVLRTWLTQESSENQSVITNYNSLFERQALNLDSSEVVMTNVWLDSV